TTGRNQELNQVDSVSGNTLTLKRRTIRSYASASTATVTQITPICNTKIKGLKFEVPTSTDGGVVFFELCDGITVEECEASGSNHGAGFAASQSANINFFKCTVRDGQNLSTPARGYGIQVYESSHNVK